MESIFHEKVMQLVAQDIDDIRIQEGYLCAQHCLNALLQGSYFNAVDLANLAHQMDEEERIRMAESGIDSEDYRRFLQQPSGNMDDSGYFSVQVISSALKVWGLELFPYNGTEPMALIAQNDPSQMQAYICNYKGHWFTIRKIGMQWFNLNSVLSGPQLLSDTYLAMYFAQLQQEGYSIFIVMGAFPECIADDVILKNPVTVNSTRARRDSQSTSTEKSESKGYRLGTAEEDRAKIMEAAAAMERVKVPSRVSFNVPSTSGTRDIAEHTGMSQSNEETIDKPKERIIPIQLEGEDDDEEEANFQRALQLSLREIQEDTDKPLQLRLALDSKNSNVSRTRDVIEDPDEDEEIRKALQLSLECVTAPATPDPDDELRKALQLSLECVTAPTTPDPDDLRRRRLAHLGIHSRTTNTDSSTKLNT